MASRLASPAPSRPARRAEPPRQPSEPTPAEGLLGYSLAATVCLLVLPGATVALLARLGGPAFSGASGWLVTAVVSLAYMVGGSKLWSRHQRSDGLSFGELVLWSWARRRHAEGTLGRGADLFDDEAAELLNPGGRRGQVMILRELNAALEVRDPYTRGHARRVERHAHRIALALRCSDDDIFDIRLAASLHDVGKIKVADRILRKDGPLDPSEWEIMQQHSAVGAELVERLGNDNVVAAVRYHHERWDGRGYPDGVSGTQIPLGARIIAVADTFDAITSCRPYRNRSDRAHAISVIKSEAGKQFDPAVVSAFLSTTPHQAAAFAGLAALVAPLARKLTSQVGVLFNKAGAVGLAGTMTASAFTGAAAVERPLAQHEKKVKEPVAAAPAEEADAAAGAEDVAPPSGRPGAAPSPRGKALGHSKKAHEGGNGKSQAGGKGKALGHSKKSAAGGKGKALGHSKKAHAGGNGKSHAGGNGKSHAGGNGKAKGPKTDPAAAATGTNKPKEAEDPTAAPPAAQAPAPVPAKPAKPKGDPATAEEPVEAPPAAEPVDAPDDEGKANGKTK